MHFKGRTVAVLVIAAMIGSSLLTMTITASDVVQQWFEPQNKQVQSPSKQPTVKQPTSGLKLDKIKKAYDILRTSYVEQVNEDDLINGAINGMLKTLEDPYTVYLDPEAAQQFQESLESSFEGIGAEVNMQNGRVTIVAPIKGAPAEKAGLRPKDQILFVNGINLEGMTLYEAVSKIRGPKGSKAQLVVSRPGVPNPIEIVVVRAEIPIETVYSKTFDDYGYIQITQFNIETAQDFKKQLQSLEEKGIKGLVIDVRDDPGGLLEIVVEIAQELVPAQKPILQVEGRTGEGRKFYSDLNEPKPYPIVVLINGGSASASEILAAALKESAGYPLIGETTFGKGTVQRTESMSDGSNIKLTIAKWLTPNGNWIHEKGIKPDIAVKQPEYFYTAPLQVEKELKLDMNSQQVVSLQKFLVGLGLDPGRTDGYFSKQTESAVKAFQKLYDIPVTGVVDTKTATIIGEKIFEKARDPKSDMQLQTALQTLRDMAK